MISLLQLPWGTVFSSMLQWPASFSPQAHSPVVFCSGSESPSASLRRLLQWAASVGRPGQPPAGELVGPVGFWQESASVVRFSGQSYYPVALSSAGVSLLQLPEKVSGPSVAVVCSSQKSASEVARSLSRKPGRPLAHALKGSWGNPEGTLRAPVRNGPAANLASIYPGSWISLCLRDPWWGISYSCMILQGTNGIL